MNDFTGRIKRDEWQPPAGLRRTVTVPPGLRLLHGASSASIWGDQLNALIESALCWQAGSSLLTNYIEPVDVVVRWGKRFWLS